MIESALLKSSLVPMFPLLGISRRRLYHIPYGTNPSRHLGSTRFTEMELRYGHISSYLAATQNIITRN